MKQSQVLLERILAKHLLRIPDEVWTDLRALQKQLDEDIGYGCQRSCQVGLNWLRQRWDENVDGDQKPTVVRDKP